MTLAGRNLVGRRMLQELRKFTDEPVAIPTPDILHPRHVYNQLLRRQLLVVVQSNEAPSPQKGYVWARITDLGRKTLDQKRLPNDH